MANLVRLPPGMYKPGTYSNLQTGLFVSFHPRLLVNGINLSVRAVTSCKPGQQEAKDTVSPMAEPITHYSRSHVQGMKEHKLA